MKHVCFDFMKTVLFSHFKQDVYSGYEPNGVAVLCSQYGGIERTKPRTSHRSYCAYMSGTPCYDVNYGYSGLYPSPSVMSDSEGYLLKYMNGTITYFSPMVRINHPILGKYLWALVLQWNPFKADTIGTRIFVRYGEVSVAQGFRYSRA